LFSAIKIASRKTTLARIQAYMVGHAIRRFKQEKPLEFLFMETQGDKNLESPLWKMEGKGVFTKDFRDDLLNDKFDMVVHSWKDLDLEPDPETEIISVLGRADQRDLLFFKKSSLESTEKVKIFTSSPRRMYNLNSALKEIFPVSLRKLPLEFEPVRGSIRRRIEKWLESDADGLVMAKAAIDRILAEDYPEAKQEDFVKEREFLRGILSESLFMVLPLSLNPNAPAQGGVAVEIRKGREDVKRILSQISIPIVSESICKERDELAKYGGGCHQKIGVSVVPRANGFLVSKRGEADSGEVLQQFEFLSPHHDRALDPKKLWPQKGEALRFARIPISMEKPPSGNLLITRSTAWNPNWKQSDLQGILWAAGVKTMKDLADKDLWVSGTLDGLGEEENIGLEKILPRQKFVKLTHDQSEEIESRFERIVTYQLKLEEEIPNLQNKSHFYWMSGYQFDLVMKKYPDIVNANHASGPGITRKHIEKRIGKKVDVFLSLEDWLKYHTEP
jgi:hydroxymethylbilane synthase